MFCLQPLWCYWEAGGFGAGECGENGGGGVGEERSQTGSERAQTLPQRGNATVYSSYTLYTHIHNSTAHGRGDASLTSDAPTVSCAFFLPAPPPTPLCFSLHPPPSISPSLCPAFVLLVGQRSGACAVFISSFQSCGGVIMLPLPTLCSGWSSLNPSWEPRIPKASKRSHKSTTKPLGFDVTPAPWCLTVVYRWGSCVYVEINVPRLVLCHVAHAHQCCVNLAVLFYTHSVGDGMFRLTVSAYVLCFHSLCFSAGLCWAKPHKICGFDNRGLVVMTFHPQHIDSHSDSDQIRLCAVNVRLRSLSRLECNVWVNLPYTSVKTLLH